MSIINTIANWFRATPKDDAGKASYKVEPPVDTTWPFPSTVGSVPVEGMGVIKEAETKPAAMSAKPKTPAKPKAVKSVVTPKSPVTKPKTPAKPKAVTKPKTPAKPKAPSKKA